MEGAKADPRPVLWDRSPRQIVLGGSLPGENRLAQEPFLSACVPTGSAARLLATATAYEPNQR